jgi:predicted dehydrogenase
VAADNICPVKGDRYMKKKYVIAGASARAFITYALPMVERFKDSAELAGLYDPNIGRARYVSQACGNIPVYQSFDEMLISTKPDIVIVTSVDAYHHEYIIKALEAGCDAIVEKPMTIDFSKAQAILDIEKRTGKKIIVTFNCRFIPYVARVKELMMSGIIGTVLNVDMEWMLDRIHGASYFRRWNRYLAKSGSLLIHKASHHFDMVNWWIGEDPAEVYAFGSLRVYGKAGTIRGRRCLDCVHAKTCEFYYDLMADEHSRKFYYDFEAYDNYIRDKCVFDEDIDIYDTMSVNVRYSGGAFLSYSLTAHSPYEGWKVSINGSKGRLEAQVCQSGQRGGDPADEIRVYNQRGDILTYSIMKVTGMHNGGDDRMLDMLIGGYEEDPLGLVAGSWQGAMSCLIGASANISIAEKRPVIIAEEIHV